MKKFLKKIKDDERTSDKLKETSNKLKETAKQVEETAKQVEGTLKDIVHQFRGDYRAGRDARKAREAAAQAEGQQNLTSTAPRP